MEAKGQLLPVEIGQVFAPRDGIVQEIKVKPGERLKTGAPAVYLYNDELKKDINHLIDEQNAQTAKRNGARAALRGVERGTRSEEVEIHTAMQLAELQIKNADESLKALYQTYNADSSVARRGFFLARIEDKDERKRPTGAVRWTVLNDEKENSCSAGPSGPTSRWPATATWKGRGRPS